MIRDVWITCDVKYIIYARDNKCCQEEQVTYIGIKGISRKISDLE